MVMEYDYKITFKLNTPFSVEYINNKCLEYPGKRILVEVCNTKGITSSMIRELNPSVAIRIAGGFDEDRCRNGYFTGNDYEKAVIYTRNETVKILEEIEKIESGINKNWSDIQKLIYVYDRLKRGIMYEAKYESKMSSDIRSLRGLITKQTVCAGYALILKEIMDRNDIDCEYVEGYINANKTGGHAWNIVNIDGIKYPIDLTWDNSKFRAGKSNSFDWLGGDISTFCQSHHPMPEERTQDYEHTLHKIDSEVIKRIYSQMGVGRARNYQSTTYYGTRKDGSKYIVAQIGNSRIDNHDYYRYYYVDIADDGTKQEPVILYSDTNIAHLINCKKFGKPIPQNYEETVNNILFSRENIADSINKKTYYIGSVRKSNNSNKLELVSSYQEISKPEDKKNLFVYPTKRFVRSDGSVFIAQQMYKNVHKVSNTDIMRYDILEVVIEDGKYVLKGNCVFTERNFFLDNRQEMVDDYLSRERLDRKFNETGGYIGYYDANGFRVYNPDLVKYFETSKRVDIDSLDKNNQQITTTKIPDFNELKKLAKRYEVVIDIDTNDVKVRDIETGEIQVDKSIKDMAMFANIWLTSAGVKYYQDELRAGENYAFNESAEELYNIVCKELENSARGDGVIDTVSLFKNIEKYSSYKYSREIIVNLFRSPYQTEMINRLFLQSLDINYQGQKPETLYSLSYASDLIFDSERSRGR